MTHEALVPFAWQQADIDKCISTMSQEVGALIASAPGAGKTLVATEVAKGLGAQSILIIAPQGTHGRAWKRTVVRQGLAKPQDVHILIGTPKGRKAYASLKWNLPGIYVTTPQWFARQDWRNYKPDMVVFDEIHMAGSYGIATEKRLRQLRGVKYRIGLSGTPLRNKFENAWAIGMWLEASKIEPQDYWVWRLVACATKPHPFAPQGRKVTGEREPGKLFNSLTCYIQHLQRERCCEFHPRGFLEGLPAPLHLECVSIMTTSQGKFYREMETTLASSLLTEDGDEVQVHAEQFIVARNILRRCALALPSINPDNGKLFFTDDAPSPKLDSLISDLPSYEGRHTLALTHSKQFARLAVDRLGKAGYTVAGWHGDVSKPRRDQILEAFTSGELEVIVGVIAAMGTGTDGLQEVCWNLSWLSYDDDASNNLQGLGRLDRLGQSQRVIVRDYLSDQTIDVGFYGKQFERVLALESSLRKEV